MSSASWRSTLDALARDNRSGATALTRMAAAALQQAAQDGRWALVEAARAAVLAQPAMGGICRTASLALEAEDPGAALAGWLAVLEARPSAIAERAAPLVLGRGTVLTLSASSVVAETLRWAREQGWRGRVVCLESRPLLEGRALAEQLAARGLSALLAVDAAGPRLAREVELVLLGADTVAPAGLVHKIGTLGIALAARLGGTPTYALVGSEKWLPGLVAGALEPRRDPGEVLPEAGSGVEAWNSYFDLTPLRLLTALVDERGPCSLRAASARARRVRLHPSLRGLVV